MIGRPAFRRVGLWLALAVMSPSVGTGQEASFVEATQATFRALDKVTARTEDIALSPGETADFGTLSITLHRCVIVEGNQDGSRARLEVVGETSTGESVEVFSGWMFARKPWLNPLEHATYDVWLQSCKTS